MVVLEEVGILEVFHYAPLHYLPFIVRANALKAKPTLLSEGFAQHHFRSMSRHHDMQRGFGGFLHLTTHSFPPILAAKLAGGFPHIRLAIPSATLATHAFDLCRFNVAMTRQLRRNGKSGFPESASNGRYYADMQVPVARTREDKLALLERHAARGEMVEVLVPGSLPLSANVRIDAFSEADWQLASTVVARLGRSWLTNQVMPPTLYPRSSRYANAVRSFIQSAIANPNWRGNGLEFDRVTAE